MSAKTLLPGDQVGTHKALILFHPVIYVGNEMFVEKSKTGLVRLRHRSSFPAVQKFTVVYRPPPAEASTIVQRALERLGQEDYDVFRANCQHFVSKIYTGQRRSEQVEGLKCLAVIAALFALGAAFAG